MREFSTFAGRLTGHDQLTVALDQRFESIVRRHATHDDCGEIGGCGRSVPYNDLKRDNDLNDQKDARYRV